MNFTAILGAMLRLVPLEKQHDEYAAERYTTIAEAIENVSAGDERMAKMLVTVALHESSFREDVHAGRARGDGGRAYCLGQVHPTEHGVVGKDLIGTDLAATERCMRTVKTVLTKALNRCGTVGGAFSIYGTGRTCNYRGEFVAQRMRTMGRL